MSFKKNVDSFLVGMVLLSIGLVLGRVGYVTVTVNGLQAEAKLMLTYLSTLQKAQHMESDKYLYFQELYGAPLNGTDHCQQPEGAAKLGFLLKWCHQETSVPLRFSYRLNLTEKGYQAEAISGSDNLGASFVCFGFNEQSVWKIDESRTLYQEKRCTSYF